MTSLSRETRIYLALWRKAARGEPVLLKLQSESLWISARQGLYRAIRPYRDGTIYDADLTPAAENLVVSGSRKQQSDNLWHLSISPRQTLAALEDQLPALGLTEADLLLPSEKRIATDLDKLLDQPTPRSTPFYNRD